MSCGPSLIVTPHPFRYMMVQLAQALLRFFPPPTISWVSEDTETELRVNSDGLRLASAILAAPFQLYWDKKIAWWKLAINMTNNHSGENDE